VGGLISALALVFGVLLGGAGCATDFEAAAVGLGREDHGWLVSIEPDEAFEVGLIGNALHPDARWKLVDHDPSVVALTHQEHEKISQDLEELTLDPRVTLTLFFFAGVELGETPLVFALEADGERIGITEYTIDVVEDSCDVEIGIVANRCGRNTGDQPQELTELSHGWLVALEPGNSIDVTLTGNPQYPRGTWRVVEFDDSVLALEGTRQVAADRVPGDWSLESRASFLPTWTFTLRALDLGRSRFVVDLLVGERRVDVYSLTLDVVDDACSVPSNHGCNR
jgi:hypothetical protein